VRRGGRAKRRGRILTRGRRGGQGKGRWWAIKDLNLGTRSEDQSMGAGRIVCDKLPAQPASHSSRRRRGHRGALSTPNSELSNLDSDLCSLNLAP
jgi:hypothetical protein